MMDTRYSTSDDPLVEIPDLERKRRLQEAKSSLARLDDALTYWEGQVHLYRKKKADLIVQIEALQQGMKT